MQSVPGIAGIAITGGPPITVLGDSPLASTRTKASRGASELGRVFINFLARNQRVAGVVHSADGTDAPCRRLYPGFVTTVCQGTMAFPAAMRRSRPMPIGNRPKLQGYHRPQGTKTIHRAQADDISPSHTSTVSSDNGSTARRPEASNCGGGR